MQYMKNFAYICDKLFLIQCTDIPHAVQKNRRNLKKGIHTQKRSFFAVTFVSYNTVTGSLIGDTVHI